MANVYPVQARTIDPYASYNSNTVNRLTRLITHGKNCIHGTHSLEVVQDTTAVNTVIVKSGQCFVDDVLIQITEDFSVDLTDPSFYISSPYWNEAGYYYLVLDYVYQKARPAPQASVKLIKPSERSLFNHERYLFLKCIEVIFDGSVFIVNELHNFDPENLENERIYPDVYLGVEESLPEFDHFEDEGRVIYVKDRDELFFGTFSKWESFNSIRTIFDTTQCEVGQLVRIDQITQTLVPAIADDITHYADAVVLQTGTLENGKGKIRLYGDTENVKIESNITISYGDKLYLSALEEGCVTNQPPKDYTQYVGTCTSLDNSSGYCSMLFMPDRCASLHDNKRADIYQDLLLQSIFLRLTTVWFKNLDWTDTTATTAIILPGTSRVSGTAGNVFQTKNLTEIGYTGPHLDKCQLSVNTSDSTSAISWFVSNSNLDDEWEPLQELNQVHVFSVIRLPITKYPGPDFQVGEKVLGTTSSKTGFVTAVGSDFLLIKDVSPNGSFQVGETVNGLLSGAGGDVSDPEISRLNNTQLRIKAIFNDNAEIYDYGILYDVDSALKPDIPDYERNLETLYLDLYELPSFDNDGLANLQVPLESAKNIIQSYIGSDGDQDFDPNYASTNFVTQGANLTQAISELDAQLNNVVVSADIQYINAFIGKDATGDILPDYTSVLNIDQNESLESAIGNLDSSIGFTKRLLTLSDGDVTPSVIDSNGHLCSTLVTANTAATTITNFDDSQAGHQIVIIFADTLTTIQSGTNIFLSGNVDFTGNINDTLTLVLNSNNQWVEISRSLNS